MAATKLTAKETALMTAIAERHFSFFDQGLVANDSGIWTLCMTEEIAGSTKYDVSKTLRGAASVINSLGRKGFLLTVGGDNEDGAWTMLTEAGQAWVEEFNGETEEAILDAAIAAQAPKAEELVFTINPNDVIYEVVDGVVTIDKDPVAEGTIPGCIIHEWISEGTEWTEVTFADASRTIKRRKQVSGQWRTDYWGAEFAGDAEHYTTAAKVKAARAAGTFTR